jgi:uncharacterized protein
MRVNGIVEMLGLFLAFSLQFAITFWFWRSYEEAAPRRWRNAAMALFAFCLSAYLVAFAMLPNVIGQREAGRDTLQLVRAGAWLVIVPSLLTIPLLGLLRWYWKKTEAPVNKSRRALAATLAATAVAAPAGVTAWASIITRRNYQLREDRILIPGLAPQLDGLRMVQITDIHYGPFLSRSDLRYIVNMANSTKADIGLVTGDLITRSSDHLDECLAELRQLRAGMGLWGCHGNHEVYAGTEKYTTEEAARFGLRFLRSENQILNINGALLNIAGVDYQSVRYRFLYDTWKMLARPAYNVLLSHTPAVFAKAAQQGWDFTVSGHTHGGQVDFEILHQHWNVVRVHMPWTRGLYRIGRSQLAVSCGIGTVGAPLRFNVPPEVNVYRLTASS